MSYYLYAITETSQVVEIELPDDFFTLTNKVAKTTLPLLKKTTDFGRYVELTLISGYYILYDVDMDLVDEFLNNTPSLYKKIGDFYISRHRINLALFNEGYDLYNYEDYESVTVSIYNEHPLNIQFDLKYEQETFYVGTFEIPTLLYQKNITGVF
jgi:hypothetical protein